MGRSKITSQIQPNKNTQRYILIKLTNVKDKERTLKAEREKDQITYKATSQ